jgi:hypothetical protein
MILDDKNVATRNAAFSWNVASSGAMVAGALLNGVSYITLFFPRNFKLATNILCSVDIIL